MSSKTMAELMASPDVGLPEDFVDICVAAKLARELQVATDVMAELEAEVIKHEEDAKGEAPAKRRRMAQQPEIVGAREAADAQGVVCDEIRDRMLAHTIPVKVRGRDSGVWRQFCDENPPRSKDDDAAGYRRDMLLANLSCNIDALALASGDWIVAYGDDEATDEMWAFLKANAIPSELIKLARKIVDLHEGTVDAGKSRRDLLATRRAANA